jgi:hypothetical protein
MIVIGTAVQRILPLAAGIGDVASWVAAGATLGLFVAAVVAGKPALDTLRTQRVRRKHRSRSYQPNRAAALCSTIVSSSA